jgi:modulator of FtsH protease
MHGYSTAGWENFFVAEVSAAAALAGLLFVAVSINLTRILEYKSLPGRAAEALLILLNALSIASVALVPGISATTLGCAVLGIGGVVWLVTVAIQIHAARLPGTRRKWIAGRAVTAQAATLPALISGASLLAGAGGGLYWIVPAALLSFVAALFDAWVLLVEIHR